ncbi:Chaperone J-domain-containing protein [Glarea lozoyensis ATCC 20868]|uniref:Chaperone J-domain-containing protein n=1 Tax=Glarea lozoyensis (strain ATCC 20868 / MF5171) TaxID=1116229 RepID=S3DC54_GLAL2|nr:Chaperone J-domain-containing protein [Glarea lozoyensis ATCC 20868]EPE36012.1 Chaperone J-domain-containing protein [Glarea lozoyensis ATCC 20868]
MLKKSTAAFSCNIQSSQISTTSLSQLHAYRTRPYKQQHRGYAMVSDGYSSHNHGTHRWPEVASANAIPTPYQIFGQKKGSPYSKQRFYELVKLYHPDRHDPNTSSGSLSYATKLERYRLIVAANDILSDPVKRGAYDCYGAGWNGMPDVARSSDEGWGNGARGWGSNPNGPSQNATWEDWEKWHARDAEGPQAPRFTSNGAFVGLIVIFAALGGIGQATRVGNFSATFIEQRDALHNNISKDLMRRRRETVNFYGSREERIDNFLKQRDPSGSVDEAYRKLIPNPEICSSEDIKSRQIDIFKG